MLNTIRRYCQTRMDSGFRKHGNFLCLAVVLSCFLINSDFPALAQCNSLGPTAPITVDDEAPSIPSSRQLVAGNNVTLDTSIPNQIKVNCSTFFNSPPGRLSSSSTLPVPTADASNVTTIYYLPGPKGANITLWDSTHATLINDVVPAAGISKALTGLSSGVYDVYISDSSGSGSPSLNLVAWTNNTTRATGLVYGTHLQELVESGTEANLFLGSVDLTATGTTQDTKGQRLIGNYYSRVARNLSFTETATTYTYSTKTWRQENNGTNTERVQFVAPVVEDTVQFTSLLWAKSGSSGQFFYAGVGVNSTSTNSAQVTAGQSQTAYQSASATWCGWPGLGLNSIYPLEAGNGSGTQTFEGSGNDSFANPGIVGTCYQ